MNRSNLGAVVGLTLLAAGATGSGAQEMEAYRDTANRIREAVFAGNDGYLKLQYLCDDIGHRLSGSEGLDRAVRWAADAMRRDGQENVRLETVMVPRWERGRESAMMLAPRELSLSMLGLGGSVGTPPGGISAEVEVVVDEKELDALGANARGKIILFNNAMPAYSPEQGTGYGRTVRFRGKGARLAADKGAVACLVRSVTARSLRSPHTGMMSYGDATIRIPAAAISVEDAEMIARLRARGLPVTVKLNMEAADRGEATSANVVGELRGTTHPDEIVIISGHIDSWDVGQGAHDDGGGAVMAMEALNVLRKLNLRPRRTIRVVLWTAEEVGMHGVKQYVTDHADELPRHVAAIESDIGSFRPTNYSVDAKDRGRRDRAAEQLRSVLSLCAPLGVTEVRAGWSSSDVGRLKAEGVVAMGHNVDPRNYFDYHHTHADTLDKIDPRDFDYNIAVMATVAYIVADLPWRIGDPVKR